MPRADPPEPDNENYSLFEEAELSTGQEFAFDEMNIVEMPIALLTRDTKGIHEIPLSADGQSRLVCANSSKYGLPNALAPKVILGLMWLWGREYPDQPQTFTFRLRRLVQQFMYPERFQRYPPSGDLLQSVERQIHCVAGSQIHTDRWWDISRRARKEVDISIIDGVVTVDEGGRNRPRVLEVTWGKYFWQSLVNRYTKPIDARLVQTLEKPLDLALYRLLDRQLNRKPRQKYTNIIHLARFKLGMQGQKISAGGRTASSYIAKLLREALTRLSREQFTVRMTIDRSTDVFSVTFERIDSPKPQQAHEVREHDQAGDLIREFHFRAHKVPRDQKRARIARADRKQAAEWVDAYGVDKATWMVKHCVDLQRQAGNDPILLFRGLRLYEAAACGAYEADQQKRAVPQVRHGQKPRDIFDKVKAWQRYEDGLLAAFPLEHGRKAERELKAKALEIATKALAKMPSVPKHLLDNTVEAELARLVRLRMEALDQDAFCAYPDEATLRQALSEHHGFDPMG